MEIEPETSKKAENFLGRLPAPQNTIKMCLKFGVPMSFRKEALGISRFWSVGREPQKSGQKKNYSRNEPTFKIVCKVSIQLRQTLMKFFILGKAINYFRNLLVHTPPEHTRNDGENKVGPVSDNLRCFSVKN